MSEEREDESLFRVMRTPLLAVCGIGAIGLACQFWLLWLLPTSPLGLADAVLVVVHTACVVGGALLCACLAASDHLLIAARHCRKHHLSSVQPPSGADSSEWNAYSEYGQFKE